MLSWLSRVLVHTILLIPSLAIYIYGGAAIALLIALWMSGHSRLPFLVCLAIVFYPLTGWWYGVFNGWKTDYYDLYA